MATRWGILGAGSISSDFASALVSQDQNEHQIVAVAARSKDRAQVFADKYGIPNAYGRYEDVVKNADVDVVYIGTIHPEHHKLSLLCLKAGKNVLCEKPVTMTLAAAKEVFALAKEKKLFFMEAFWSRCFPVYEQIQRELEAGTLGEVLMVLARFCMSLYHVPRVRDKSLGGGGLLDIGCYCVMMADYIYKETPEKITAEGQVDENGVDTGAVITLRYSGGRMASLVYNTRVTASNDTATIMGTKGSIEVDNHFWFPSSMTSPMGRFEFQQPVCKVADNASRGGRGFQFEQRHVRDCLQKGLLESPLISHASSERIMHILETCLKQMGVKYDFPHTV